MLYLSLGALAILLVLANLAVHWHRGAFAAFGFCGLACSLGPIGVGVLLPPVVLGFLALAVAMTPWYSSRRRPWLYLPVSVAAVAVAFAFPLWYASAEWQKFARLRQQFPFESVEDRVPSPRPVDRLGELPASTDGRLADLEDMVEHTRHDYGMREYFLKELHEDTTSLFVNSPGFGVGRLSRPSAGNLTLPEAAPVPQPEPGISTSWPPEGAEWGGRPASADLYTVHHFSIADFVNLNGFGYVRDRRHVAGFVPHRFTEVPAHVGWTARRIELVGLLRHDRPVAYLSDHLPRMGELREAPTRPLGRFEAAALARLRAGEDLIVERAGDRVRMLGAIRSGKQCVECHGGSRGGLLGAFSYLLQRTER